MEVAPSCPWFPVDFRPPLPGLSPGTAGAVIGTTGIRFLGILFPAWGFRLSLRSAYRTAPRRPGP